MLRKKEINCSSGPELISISNSQLKPLVLEQLLLFCSGMTTQYQDDSGFMGVKSQFPMTRTLSLSDLCQRNSGLPPHCIHIPFSFFLPVSALYQLSSSSGGLSFNSHTGISAHSQHLRGSLLWADWVFN